MILQKNYLQIFFIIGYLVITITSLNAQSWMSVNWTHRRLVTITNPGITVLTDFQVKIILNDSTFNFSEAKNDGSDIRLTTNDGMTPIPFWIEEWNYGTQATIWVKVPNIPTSGTTVYLYYGNNTAIKVGNGFNTFDFFDDFESWITTPTSIWNQLAPLPIPIADLATAVYNGKIYSFGGYGNGPGNSLNKNYLYDPVTNIWAEKTPMPTARWGMVAVVFDSLIYVFGGSDTNGFGDIRKNEVYDPVLDKWSTKTDIPPALARQGLMGIRFGNKIHLFYESDHYEYDPVTDTYTQKANVPNPRFWCTSAVVGSKIYLIGGYHGGVANNDNQEYDPATDSWTAKAPLPTIRWGTARENPVINGKIYVSLGIDGHGFYTSNFMYDPALDTWVQKGPAVHRRDGVGCAVISNKLYVIGGRADFVGPYGLVYNEVYDPSVDMWTPQPGPDWWATSGIGYVYANDSAKFQGNYGLVVQQPLDTTIQRYAKIGKGYGSVYALDFDWQITDIGGIGSQPKPQGLVTLTETDDEGSLFFYNSGGVPAVKWYSGSGFNFLQNSSWNSWHKVTVVRNGNNSRVSFDGNQYQDPVITSPPLTGSGIIQFGVYFTTRQYLDNVRVRKWAGVDPLFTLGAGEAVHPVTLTLTALIEGLYNTTLMVSDTVSVELHKTNSPYALIESQKGILNSAGVGTFTFTNSLNDTSYYIVVKHRNALETWSKTGNAFASNVLSYNFTSAASQAYGNNLKLKGGKYCLFSGDVNHDGLVDLTDLISVDNDSSSIVTGYTNTDINGDGIVDLSDLIIVDNNNSAYVTRVVPLGAPAAKIIQKSKKLNDKNRYQ